MTGIVGALLAFAVGTSSGLVVAEYPVSTGEISYRDRGTAVARLNIGLENAGFNPDTGERFGKKTLHAVYAFQKHHGLPRTGVFTPFMWDLLAAPIELPWRPEADRIEIDLAKQVLYVVADREVVRVVPISSGNGKRYFGENGHEDIARTPEGEFRIQRNITGWRESFLGQMWNPYYFYRGFAIHGSLDVPNYPASHGCIRVTMWDMDLLVDSFELGQTVYIYGKRTLPPPAGLNHTPPRFV